MCYASVSIDTQEEVIWKEIPGFSDYLISNEGDVWSNITNKFLIPATSSGGSSFALRNNNGIIKRKAVRNILCEVFGLFKIDTKDSNYWKRIPNFPEYFVNINGEVWSEYSKKVLTPKNFSGYKGVHLTNDSKILKAKLVHELLLETFIGSRPDGYVCNHRDGNKHNNNLNNIEWTTYSENNKHAYKSGLKIPSRNELRGEKSHLSKLNEKEVLFIRKLHKEGITIRMLSECFPIGCEGIRSIIKKKIWKQLQERELTEEEVEELNNIRKNTPNYKNWDCIRGSKSKRAKLKEEDVIKIKKLLRSGFLRGEIANMFGVTKGCIVAINRGLTWSWLKEENK